MDTFLPFPKVLRIEPASQCNLACIHCPTGTIDMDRGIMQESTFEKILQEVSLHKDEIKVIVLYHGGEPLLNKNFAKMIQKLKDINPHFFLKTVSNGMALTQERSRELIESKLDAIEFSLDGISAQESEFIRKKSDVIKIVANIKKLITFKQETNTICPEISIATTQFFSKEYPLSDYPNPNVPTWLKETFNEKDIKEFKTTYTMKWPHMGDTGMFDFIKVERVPASYCDHIINTMTIRADGSVVPCCFDLTSQLTMGNIQNNSLLDIWMNEKYNFLRVSIENKKLVSICKNCLVLTSSTYLIPKWRTP